MHKNSQFIFLVYTCQMRGSFIVLISILSVSGFSQNSLHFDGANDALNCGTASVLNVGGTAFSLEAWIYADNWKTNVFEGSIVLKEENTTNGGFMLRAGNSGVINFGIGAGNNGAWTEMNTAAILNAATWYHLAATYDGSKMRMYVDGLIVDSLNATISVGGSATTPLTIGYQPIYAGRNWSGRIDEVRIWNKTLTASEIMSNKDSEFCSLNVANLAGYYKLDAGSALGTNTGITSAIDYSGYGNNGTLTNFALSGNSSNWVTGAQVGQDTVGVLDSTSHCGSFYDAGTGQYITATTTIARHIPSYSGCDSFITRKFVVNANSLTEIDTQVCDSFISPLGTVYRTSGTYYESMPSANGCDSFFTMVITVGVAPSFIDTAVCYRYTSPSGITYTQSGTYYENFSSAKGCDSIEQIDLKIYQATSSNLEYAICDSILNPSMTSWLLPGNTYIDTLTNQYGCDSLISITVSSLASFYDDTVQSCVSYTTPSGNMRTTSGQYIDTIPNVVGCDSIISIHLTILEPTSVSVLIEGCYMAELPSSGEIVSASGIYVDTIRNASGCDSIVTMKVTIHTVNTKVKVADYSLTALSSSGTFQWLDCADYAQITGQTGAEFEYQSTGSFAVEVSENKCTDTSECYNLTGLGLDNLVIHSLVIVPNPAAGSFSISSKHLIGEASIRIISAKGEVVWEEKSNGKAKQALNTNLKVGVYVLEVLNGDNRLFERLMIYEY